MSSLPPTRDPDETVNIRTLIADVVPNYEVWLREPNTKFGFRPPIELIGRPEEVVLRNAVLAYKYGTFS